MNKKGRSLNFADSDNMIVTARASPRLSSSLTDITIEVSYPTAYMVFMRNLQLDFLITLIDRRTLTQLYH
jgi:hypothetical protein